MEGIPVLTASQTKELDRRAEAAGVPGRVLMEAAGRAVAEAILRRFSPRRVVLVSGKGGNGGDALVAARALSQAGVEVQAFSPYPEAELAPLTRTQAEALGAVAPDALHILDDPAPLQAALARADVAVDGLLGIGVDRPLHGRIAQIVEILNRSSAKRVAIDLPSGLAADTGELLGESVHADRSGIPRRPCPSLNRLPGCRPPRRSRPRFHPVPPPDTRERSAGSSSSPARWA